MQRRAPSLRRREIVEGDLPAVVDLLAKGFPARPRDYWRRGLHRLGQRAAMPDCARYGFLLDGAAGPVGVLLTLFSAAGPGGAPRCNLSSWTVEPAYRMQAPLLVAAALKRSDVTYTNVSPAPHTWGIIEAQGFRVYAEGQSVLAPAFGARGEAAEVRGWPAAEHRHLPEAGLLDDHLGYGCACLVVEAADGPHPFVFQPFRMRAGRVGLPLMELVFCRDPADLARFATVLGRALVRRGYAGIVVDGAAPGPGLRALLHVRRARRYYKGPHPPRVGDLSYSERVIFGA